MSTLAGSSHHHPSSSNPLFSALVTLYTLFYLYSPTLLLRLALSPVFIFAGLLLILLARLAAPKQPVNDKVQEEVTSTPKESYPNSYRQGAVVVKNNGWDFGAPLEVIHECPCEGREQQQQQQRPQGRKADNQTQMMISKYYPESDDYDSNSDSESESFGLIGRRRSRMCLCDDQEPEEEDDGLIEIQLDDVTKTKGGHLLQCQHDDDFDLDQEDNLIEIDIFSPEYGAAGHRC